MSIRRTASGLRSLLAGRGAAEADPPSAHAPARTRPAEIDFVAYAEDCVVSARLGLDADRLSDYLNGRAEYVLNDVLLTALDGTRTLEAPELTLARDETVVVHGTGPRGERGRRQRTRPFPIALQLGAFHVRGYVHALPGADPILQFRRRKPMVPITEGWLSYPVNGTEHRQHISTLVVNREMLDWVAPATDEEVEFPEIVVADETGGLVKDFTGDILVDATFLGDGAGS